MNLLSNRLKRAVVLLVLIYFPYIFFFFKRTKNFFHKLLFPFKVIRFLVGFYFETVCLSIEMNVWYYGLEHVCQTRAAWTACRMTLLFLQSQKGPHTRADTSDRREAGRICFYYIDLFCTPVGSSAPPLPMISMVWPAFDRNEQYLARTWNDWFRRMTRLMCASWFDSCSWLTPPGCFSNYLLCKYELLK